MAPQAIKAHPQILPVPRQLTLSGGTVLLSEITFLLLPRNSRRTETRETIIRLHAAGLAAGVQIISQRKLSAETRGPIIRLLDTPAPPAAKRRHPNLPEEYYGLKIDQRGIVIEFSEIQGLRAAVATLRQLLHQYGRRLPCLKIRDWPDFPRRGVMLDISRGRVPTLATLLDLADKLADFKINELQLYTEHTFAYRDFKSVWRDWGALTGAEIRRLDAHCRRLGIDLVPNQNSFGHLREFLADPRLKPLAEMAAPWPDGGGTFWRYPSTLAPNHPGSLRFLRRLYDELLPHFRSTCFNVGCDETWDLGRGQSKRLCAKRGKGRVYLDFVRKIHREVTRRGRRMMFWCDIILHHPELIRKLPRDVIALNWGYEANHPFARETAQFAKAGIPFYVCPGTSTWATLVGKHDNAFANLKAAARTGRARGAIGYLTTDWGDGGHPQPLAVSWLPMLAGAALSWNSRSLDDDTLLAVASREVFNDRSGHTARAALELGLAHRRLGYDTPNATPLGAALAAPLPESHELFCRDGLKYYARVRPSGLRAALACLETERRRLARARPDTASGMLLVAELDLAARMATQSCHLMLWQQALARGARGTAKQLATRAIRELQQLDRDFTALWPRRNKATPAKCIPFLQWRIADYLCGRLHFAPEIARPAPGV